MENNIQEQIKRLQDNLSVIRKIAGWTAEEFGGKIGVTKQTISNLENKKTPMNQTQYIAIRAVLDCEIETNKENTVLPQAIAILLDKADNYSEEDYRKLKNAISAISVSAAGGVSGDTLASMFSGLLSSHSPTILGAAARPIDIFPGEAVSWLKKILKKL